MVIRTPRLLPYFLSLFFTTSAVLKLLQGGYLCADPWAPANAIMTPVELLMAWFLWGEPRREFGALLATATMVGAGALLTWAHLTGRDVAGCGCFGPIRLSYAAHLGVIGAVLFLSLAMLRAKPLPPSP